MNGKSVSPYVLYIRKKRKPETIEISKLSVDPIGGSGSGRYQINLYATDDKTIGVLNPKNVAAIFPEKQSKNVYGYHVRLRHGVQFTIYADGFNLDDGDRLIFCVSGKQLDQVYVALSELVSIVPVAGFDASTY